MKNNDKHFSRRHFLKATAGLAGLAAFQGALPAWAQSAAFGNKGISSLVGNAFDLTVGKFPISFDGRRGEAVGINGTLPGPLIRFREGEKVTLNVANRLNVDTSVHWHGLLVPFQMDGVPGLSFPGIKPGKTFKYEFAVPQSGTYWYHSHSGLQEQVGHYGPLIIDPAGDDPVSYDREYVIMLSDWSFESPQRIFAKLKKMSHTYNFQEQTFGDFLKDAKTRGLAAAMRDRADWGMMRMSATDIADVTGATYSYLVNGHTTLENWTGVFTPGERVRLRIINASAMTIFNVRMPGLPMTVVAADGLNVEPLETDEFQMGVAETYDVIIEPRDARAFAFVAESIDRSGQVVATFAPRPGMRAQAPAIRQRPTLTMKDMGMDHGSMGGMDHSSMDHSKMDHSKMNHGPAIPLEKAEIKRGPGVDNVAEMPMSRLDEPGLGLEDVPHRTLRYSKLRSLTPNAGYRTPDREMELHLTGNMERYMWSFNGVTFAHIKEAIKLYQGERVRLTMINNTMMSHPIHLHGMFFELVNGGGDHCPQKHTVIVKPGEKLSVDINVEHIGDWAFHCHLLYHMHAGMMQVVSVLPAGESLDGAHQHPSMHHGEHGA